MEILLENSGAKHQAVVDVIGNKIWIHFRGKTFVVDRESRVDRRSSAGGGSHPGKIMAPMPGKITKILVQKNQKLNSGDTVLVMEAMKMEYTLKAEISGAVAKLDCSVGDQVTLGKLLVEIQEG